MAAPRQRGGSHPAAGAGQQGGKRATPSDLLDLHDRWRAGADIPKGTDDAWIGDLLHTTVLAEGADLIVVANQGDVLASSSHKVIARLRLGDTDEERASALYLERWRRWLGLGNLLQFSGNGRSFTTSEVALVTTFTTDLSVTIEHLIAQLSPEAAKLIEVQSASTRAHHLPAVSVAWTDCDDQELGEIWDALLPPASEPDEFDRQFVKEEYESVVDAMGVTSRSGK
jgi:hypothetical protein